MMGFVFGQLLDPVFPRLIGFANVPFELDGVETRFFSSGKSVGVVFVSLLY